MAQAARKIAGIVEVPARVMAKMQPLQAQLRDSIISFVKGLDKPYKDMTANEREKVFSQATYRAHDLISTAAECFAARGFDYADVTFSTKSQLERVKLGTFLTASIVAEGTDDNNELFRKMLGERVVVVPLALDDFLGNGEVPKSEVVPGDLRIPDEPHPANAAGAGEPHDPETGELPPVPATGAPPEHQAPLEGGAKAEGT